MRPPIHEYRRFFATSTNLRSPSGAWPLAAVAMLMLGTLATPSFGGTDVIGGSTTSLNGPSDIVDPLRFFADPGGSGDPAVLDLLTGGPYSGECSINNVSAVFNLNGGSLLLLPTVGAGTATGDANLLVTNGTLQLGTNSFLTGFGSGGTGGTLGATNGGSLVIDDKQWIESMTLLQLGGSWTSGAAATFTYSYSGAEVVPPTDAGFSLLNGGASAIALSGAGSLTFTGNVQGTGDLVVISGGGAGTVNLAFSTGSFDGHTVIDGTSANIDTQNAVGLQGLTLNNGAVTVAPR